MDLEARRARRSRSWLGALAALVTHVALASALPHEAPHTADASAVPTLVWLSDQAAGSHENASFEAGSEPAPAPSARRVARRRHATPEPVSAPAATAAHAASADADESVRNAELAAAQAPTSPDVDSKIRGILDGVDGGTGTGHDLGGAGASAHGHGSAGAPHGPGLLHASTSCASYFPSDATTDYGEVQVRVHVDASGHPDTSEILLEHPRAQGFGRAASACARQLRFDPAVDVAGAPIVGEATLKLRFRRG